jgi:hypothetical protein
MIPLPTRLFSHWPIPLREFKEPVWLLAAVWVSCIKDEWVMMNTQPRTVEKEYKVPVWLL